MWALFSLTFRLIILITWFIWEILVFISHSFLRTTTIMLKKHYLLKNKKANWFSSKITKSIIFKIRSNWLTSSQLIYKKSLMAYSYVLVQRLSTEIWKAYYQIQSHSWCLQYVCYSCDVARSKLRRSRTTFNKSLVYLTLISQRRTSSYEKHKEDNREKIRAHSLNTH